MRAPPIPVVVDADVLYGATTRGLLAYLDHHDVIRMHWSPLLLVEASRALVRTGRLTAIAAARNEELMACGVRGGAVPTLRVQAAFARAWPGVRDAKDLHVAACAVALQVDAWYPNVRQVHLVTRNAKDFAPKKLATLDVVQRHPDAFLLDRWIDAPREMAAAFRMFRTDLPSGPSVERLLEKLVNDGQKRTASAMLQSHLAAAATL